MIHAIRETIYAMATTLRAMSGHTFQKYFAFKQSSGDPVDTEGFVVRMTLVGLRDGTVILRATESEDEGSILEIVGDAEWSFYLPGDITRTLPHTVGWELEIAATGDPTNVSMLADGVIKVVPELAR